MDLNARVVYADEFGRLQPDPNRFPSSMGSQGFKALAAYAHSLGLLFGIHTMRGVSEVAIAQKLPVRGTNYTADEVYDRNGACPWQPGSGDIQRFYSLNMSHPGGQAFYDALYEQYAEWGVDFIKNDVGHHTRTALCVHPPPFPRAPSPTALPVSALPLARVSRLFPPQCVYANYVPEQIAGVSRAILRSGREMLYSLSPGDDNNQWAQNVSSEVSMYRVTGDTWDRWDNIRSHFLSAQHMQPFIAHPNGRYGLPSWPDLDMLPLGWLGIEGSNIQPLRLCNLTTDEQQTLMSLWTIFRSPLMYGGDLQHPDAASLALITNTEALRITDASINNAFVVSNATTAVWRADSVDWRTDGLSYFTVHNLMDAPQNVAVSVESVRGVQKAARCTLRDVWAKRDLGAFTAQSFTLRPHASGLYALHNCTAAPDVGSGERTQRLAHSARARTAHRGRT